MQNLWFKKYLSWNGRCGAYAKHNGLDDKLKRMNRIRDEYLAMAKTKSTIREYRFNSKTGEYDSNNE